MSKHSALISLGSRNIPLRKNLRQLLATNPCQKEDGSSDQQDHPNGRSCEQHELLTNIHPLALLARPQRRLRLSVPVDALRSSARANEARLACLGSANALTMVRAGVRAIRACVKRGEARRNGRDGVLWLRGRDRQR